MIDGIIDWAYRIALRARYRQCHNAAFRICLIGFENPAEAQVHLDAAKDSLYRAARAFKEEVDKP